MKNKEIKIALKNTDNSYMRSLQQQLVSIFYEQYKKGENMGLFQKVTPVDLVIDVEDSDLNETNFSNLFLQNMEEAKRVTIHKIKSERAFKQLEVEFTKAKTLEKGMNTITIPFLIELILHKFLQRKEIKNYEKMQWTNLIVFFSNIKTENEAEAIQKFIKKYNSYTGIFGNDRSGDETSEIRLHNLYFKLASFVEKLVRENKAKYLKKRSTTTHSNLSIDHIILAITNLYLRNPEYSKYTKTYWEGIIKSLNAKNPLLTPKNIASLPQFNELQQYIYLNASALENELQEKIILLQKSLTNLYNYSKEYIQESISTTQLILAIIEKYLTNDGLYSNETAYWLSIIEDLIAQRTDVASVLMTPENIELKFFLYEDYTLRPEEKPSYIHIEDYKEILITELKRIIQDFLETTISNDTKKLTFLYRIVYNSLHELEKGVSLLETLQKEPSLFLILKVFVDIKQLSNPNLYPLIAPIYDDFVSSNAYTYLEDKTLFKLKDELEEVVIKATSRNVIISNLKLHEGDRYNRYTFWIVEPKHIFKFITSCLYQQKSFRSIIPLHKNIAFKQINWKFIHNGYRYNISYAYEGFDRIANLNPSDFEFKYTSGIYHYEYTIYIKDKLGETAFTLSTKNYQAFEALSKILKFTPNPKTIQNLIDDFKLKFKEAGENIHKLDKLYAGLPTFFFNSAIDKNEKEEKNKVLKKHLIAILKGRVNENRGTNEEMAVVNIVKAMSEDYAYALFKDDTKLLYTVFRKLHQYWVSTGTAYQDFSDYMISLILKFSSKTAFPKIWFSNENWSFNRIEIDISNWSETTKDFTIKNYYQKGWIPLFNLNGTNEFLSDPNYTYHPLDLVEMQTMIHGKPVSATLVPVFMLYHKATSKANWDTFSVVTDIISVLSVYAAGRVLVSKAAFSLGQKVLAGAIIGKEISTKTIQYEGLTYWLQRNHKALYRTWTTVDTLGDFALLFTSLAKADEIITNSRNLLNNLRAAEIVVPNEYLNWLQKAKKALGKLFDPKTGKKIVLSLEGGAIKFPINLPTVHAFHFNNTLDDLGNTFRSLLNGKAGKIREHLEKDIGKLMLTATGKFKDDLTKLAVSLRGFSGDNQKLLSYIIDFERIKLNKGKSVLSGEQIKMLQQLESLQGVSTTVSIKFINYILKEGKSAINLTYLFNIIDKINPKNIEHLLKIIDNIEGVSSAQAKTLLIKLSMQNGNAEVLATFTKKELEILGKKILPEAKFGRTEGDFINQKEFFDQVGPEELKKLKDNIEKHPYVSFDLKFLKGKRKKDTIDRFEKARLINMAKMYKDVALIGEKGKKYFEHVNKQIKEFILSADDLEFNEFLNMYRVNGKAGNDFMPKYKKFGEGMEKFRGKKITSDQLKDIMENMRRHHIIMANVLQKNEVFQKIMQWAKSQVPPKGIGFHDFRKNIIILHHDQHGFHNAATSIMQKKVRNLNNIFNETEKKIDHLKELIEHGTDKSFREAFFELKIILKDEKYDIIKNVIQKNDGALDTKHLPK